MALDNKLYCEGFKCEMLDSVISIAASGDLMSCATLAARWPISAFFFVFFDFG